MRFHPTSWILAIVLLAFRGPEEARAQRPVDDPGATRMTRARWLPVSSWISERCRRGPRHGYGIKLDFEAHTGGAICLGPGTLYEAIQRLTGLGWIDEV